MKRIYFLNPRRHNAGGGERPTPARKDERGLPKVEAKLKETSLLLAEYQRVKDSGKGGEVLAEAIRNLMNAVEALQDEMLRISKTHS